MSDFLIVPLPSELSALVERIDGELDRLESDGIGITVELAQWQES